MPRQGWARLPRRKNRPEIGLETEGWVLWNAKDERPAHIPEFSGWPRLPGSENGPEGRIGHPDRRIWWSKDGVTDEERREPTFLPFGQTQPNRIAESKRRIVRLNKFLD